MILIIDRYLIFCMIYHLLEQSLFLLYMNDISISKSQKCNVNNIMIRQKIL